MRLEQVKPVRIGHYSAAQIEFYRTESDRDTAYLTKGKMASRFIKSTRFP